MVDVRVESCKIVFLGSNPTRTLPGSYQTLLLSDVPFSHNETDIMLDRTAKTETKTILTRKPS